MCVCVCVRVEMMEGGEMGTLGKEYEGEEWR